MLGLVKYLKDGFEDNSVLVTVHALIDKIQTVVEGVATVHISQHGFCQMESGHIRRSAFNRCNKSIFLILQHLLGQVMTFVAAKLQEVILQDATHNIHQRNSSCQVAVFCPKRRVGILHRIVVLILVGYLLSFFNAKLNGGYVVLLIDFTLLTIKF